jgi:hypothetical protein
MRNQVSYEWAIEESDEHGDIYSTDHAETLAEALTRKADLESFGDCAPTVEIALVRHEGNQIDGEQVRFYAYLRDDGTLPAAFSSSGGSEDGPVVPQRFHKEVAA